MKSFYSIRTKLVSLRLNETYVSSMSQCDTSLSLPSSKPPPDYPYSINQTPRNGKVTRWNLGNETGGIARYLMNPRVVEDRWFTVKQVGELKLATRRRDATRRGCDGWYPFVRVGTSLLQFVLSSTPLPSHSFKSSNWLYEAVVSVGVGSLLGEMAYPAIPSSSRL